MSQMAELRTLRRRFSVQVMGGPPRPPTRRPGPDNDDVIDL